MTQTNDHAGEPAVLVDKRGHAMWVTLNRPDKRNAINKDAVAGIRDGWRRAHADSDVRVIVLTAAGEKAFCAGGDLQPGAGFAFDLSQPNIDYADMLREVQNATLLASAGEPFVREHVAPAAYDLLDLSHADKSRRDLSETIDGRIAVIDAVADGKAEAAIAASDHLMGFVEGMFDVLEREVDPSLLDCCLERLDENLIQLTSQ